MRGDAAFAQRDYEKAVQAYRRVPSRGAQGVEARYKLGVTQALLGRVKAAAATWEELLRQAPDHVPAREALFRARLKLLSQREQQGGSAAGMSAQGLLNEARTLLDDASYAQASAVLAQARVRGAGPAAWLLEGEAWMGLGDPRQAAQAYHKAAGSGPEGTMAMMGLGDAWLHMGYADRAAYFYDLALLLSAGSAALPPAREERARQRLDQAVSAEGVSRGEVLR